MAHTNAEGNCVNVRVPVRCGCQSAEHQLLTSFRRQRVWRRSSIPWPGDEPLPPLMFVERFTGGEVTIYNSIGGPVGLAASNTFFYTWCDAIGVVTGSSLVRPWRRIKGDGHVIVTEPVEICARQESASVVDVFRQDGTAHFRVRAAGLANHVYVEREGQVVGHFPAVGSGLEIDLDGLTHDEAMLFLAVLGSGAVRRARRCGILAQTVLPSPRL